MNSRNSLYVMNLIIDLKKTIQQIRLKRQTCSYQNKSLKDYKELEWQIVNEIFIYACILYYRHQDKSNASHFEINDHKLIYQQWGQRKQYQSEWATCFTYNYYLCLFHLLVQIIFTVFKFFWACSIFLEHSQIFWFKSKSLPYDFTCLSLPKNIWTHSKNIEHFKNVWTWSKNIWTSRWIRH